MAAKKYPARSTPTAEPTPPAHSNLIALLTLKPEGWEKKWRLLQERVAIDSMFDAWEQMNRVFPPDKAKRMWAGIATTSNRPKGRPRKMAPSEKDIELIKGWIRASRLVRSGDPNAPNDIIAHLTREHAIHSEGATAKRLGRAKKMLRAYIPKT